MNNIYIYTTKYIIEKKSIITYVVHDREGDWQFLGKDEIGEEDARIVSLEEIISIDPSIKEILWLPEGIEASREDLTKSWLTSVYSE